MLFNELNGLFADLTKTFPEKILALMPQLDSLCVLSSAVVARPFIHVDVRVGIMYNVGLGMNKCTLYYEFGR